MSGSHVSGPNMGASTQKTICIRVRRGDREHSWIESYTIPYIAGRSVLGGLQYICEQLDPTLAFGGSCRIGLCAACMLRVDGKARRACITLLEGDVLLEPLREERVVRDLVVED
jgi:succinate dehydrogenase/fumarate reductase-like Fe-S protein